MSGAFLRNRLVSTAYPLKTLGCFGHSVNRTRSLHRQPLAAAVWVSEPSHYLAWRAKEFSHGDAGYLAQTLSIVVLVPIIEDGSCTKSLQRHLNNRYRITANCEVLWNSVHQRSLVYNLRHNLCKLNRVELTSFESQEGKHLLLGSPVLKNADEPNLADSASYAHGPQIVPKIKSKLRVAWLLRANNQDGCGKEVFET